MPHKSFYPILIVLFFAACEKDPEMVITPPPPPRPPQPLIETLTLTYPDGGIFSQHFYYDSLWRLIKEESFNGTNLSTDTFTYDSLSIYRDGNYYLRLDTNGLAIEEPYYGSPNTYYTYNANGNMTSNYRTCCSFHNTYNGDYNLTGSHHDMEAGGGSSRMYYDYTYTYNDKLNTIGYYNKGQYYFGKSSVNLIEREDLSWEWTGHGDPFIRFTTYHYTWNDSGWVASMHQNTGSIHSTQVDSTTAITDTTYELYKFDYTYY